MLQTSVIAYSLPLLGKITSKVIITKSCFASHKRNILENNRESFYQRLETKIFVSAVIRGEECALVKQASVTTITLPYILVLSHNAFGPWRKVTDSESYLSRHNEL
jgi:hypothetical protein